MHHYVSFTLNEFPLEGYGDFALNVTSSNLHGVVAVAYMVVALIVGCTVLCEIC